MKIIAIALMMILLVLPACTLVNAQTTQTITIAPEKWHLDNAGSGLNDYWAIVPFTVKSTWNFTIVGLDEYEDTVFYFMSSPISNYTQVPQSTPWNGLIGVIRQGTSTLTMFNWRDETGDIIDLENLSGATTANVTYTEADGTFTVSAQTGVPESDWVTVQMLVYMSDTTAPTTTHSYIMVDYPNLSATQLQISSLLGIVIAIAIPLALINAIFKRR